MTRGYLKTGRTRTPACDIVAQNPNFLTLFLLYSDLGHSPTEQEADTFLLWLVCFGRQRFQGVIFGEAAFEYVTAPDGEYFSRLERFAANLPSTFRQYSSIAECHIWYYSRAVIEFKLQPFLTHREISLLKSSKFGDTDKSIFDEIQRNVGAELLQCDTLTESRRDYLSLQREEANTDPFASFSIGINLIGYANGVLGLGEDLRAMARVLKDMGVPMSICNVALSADHASSFQSDMEGFFVDRPLFPINVFCMSAFETERLRLRIGENFFHGFYNVGNWPWELSQFPRIWHHAFEQMDEIWAISPYLNQVYSDSGKKHVHYIPPPCRSRSYRESRRAAVRIGCQHFFVCCSFRLQFVHGEKKSDWGDRSI